MTRLSTAAIAAVVLLRLLTGWHFYNEGVKKLDPSFSSAGFLRTAKGPFAPLFRSMVTGPYGAYVDLAQPAEQGVRDAADQKAIDAWLADYARRAGAAIKKGDPLPADVPAELPGAGLVERMGASWKAGLVKLGVGGEAREQIESLRTARLGDVAMYLHGQHETLEELRHEAWRLEQMREEAGARPPAPYLVERIADKEAEVWRLLQPHAAELKEIDAAFRNDAREASGLSAARVDGAIAERPFLSWVDSAVTCAVLGSGVCVFLGFMTRIASLVAAGFLLSLIMTQPPWVAGADLTAFFNWAVELAAFLVLAAIGAGRWAGIDGLLQRLTAGCCRTETAAPPTQAPVAA